MRILQISHRHHVAGGSDAVFMAMTRGLAARGHHVVPFCMDLPRNLPSDWAGYFPAGADTGAPRLADLPRYLYNRGAARALARLIADHGPFDVAHLHIYHGKQTPAILPVLRRAGIPVVQSLHEYKLACPVYTLQRGPAPCTDCVTGGSWHALRHRCKDGSVLRSAVMWAEFLTARALGDVRLVDRFLCVSAFQRRIMMRAGLPAEKLHVLHNFVAPVPEAPGARPDGPLVYFGRLERLKGLPRLIDAVAASGARLVIAGDGGWRAEIQRAIAGRENIHYAGFLRGAALHALLDGARAVVVPSEWYENCPMSVLEAKARGLPVVGAAIGGIPELLREGVDGFVHRPGDTGDLGRALTALDRGDVAAMGRAARRDVARRFCPEVQLARLEAHYRALARPSVRAVAAE